MIVRNAITLPPALNGGMIAVAEQPGGAPNTSEAFDNGLCGFHGANVRHERTSVNVDNVRASRHVADMEDNLTIGQKVQRLSERSELKGDAFAKACGYKGRSSVQKYLDPTYDEPLSPKVLKGWLGLVGRGKPAIRAEDIWALSDCTDIPVHGEAQPWSPNAQTIAALLQAVRPALLATPSPEEGFGIVAHALSNGLRVIAKRPAIEDIPGELRTVVDFVADQVQTGMTELGHKSGRT